ncbi:MAG TPA: type 4a pilus biogenesis protein PilO [Gaiellaceae bacterium]|nr:type 4a pilus biogenesis protein PilO [Gaiellaceae bacterium]
MTAKLKNPKAAIALGLGAAVVISAAAWLLLVGPERSKVGKLDGQIASVQQQIDERRAALQRPKADLQVRASDVFRLNRAMPDGIDMPGIILALNRLAAKHHLQFGSLQPSAVVAQTGFNVQPLSVELEGRFADVSAFLREVRTLVRVQKRRLAATGRLFAIDSVEFAQPQGTDKTFPNVRATLAVDAFMFTGGALKTPDQSTPSSSTGTVAAGANP